MNDEKINYSNTNSVATTTNDSHGIVFVAKSSEIMPKLAETNSLLSNEQIENDINLSKSKRIDYPLKNRIGNMYVFMFDKYGEPFIIIGPHCK